MATPAPAPVLAIRAGEILTMAGPPVSNGVILVRDGRIVAVGRGLPVPRGARVIDASSRVVMPGLVAAFTTLAGADDSDETLTPHVRAADGFDYFADRRRLLEGGITTVYLATGRQRLVAGQGSVVKLAGGTPTARTLRAGADLRVLFGDPARNPPALFRPPIPPTADNPILPAQRQLASTRPSQLALLRQLLADASSAIHRSSIGRLEASTRASRARTTDTPVAAPAPEHAVPNPKSKIENRKYSALAALFRGTVPLRVTAHTTADIRKALALAKEFRLRLVLEGVTEGHQVAREIARAGASVVAEVPTRFDRPVPGDFTRQTADGRVDPANVTKLVKSGVRVALAAAEDVALPDLLPLAASEVRHGLSTDAALRTVTSDAARILGVEGRVGTLAPGKEADLVILDGDPLAARSRVEQVLVNGEVVYTRAPAPPGEGELVAIRAGKILTVSDGVVEDGVLLLRGGKVAAIRRPPGPGRGAPILPPRARVIDASRSVVMPGMIDVHSHLGLHADADAPPLEAAPATAGSASGKTRLLQALRPHDPAFREALHAGVTTVLLAPPTGGQVCGVAALLKSVDCPAHAEVCPERLVREQAAVCFNAQGGSPRRAQLWSFRDLLRRAREYHERRAKFLQDHRDWKRDAAEAMAQGKEPPKEPAEVQQDEDLEPLGALFRKEIPALVHAGRSDEIENALKVFRDEYSLETTLVGAEDAHRLPDAIRARGASVALGPYAPRREEGHMIDNGATLAQAGVPLLFHTSAASGTAYLRLHAAYAVRNGLDPDAALRALTLNPARVLGLADRLGSIAPGRDADLVILSGDPFDFRTRVEKVLVSGKVVYDAN